MTHITTIGAGMFTDISIAVPSTAITLANFLAANEASKKGYFATEIQSSGGTKAANTFVRVKNVREFPPVGTPANVVSVPVYGQKTSQQIQGQSDAPSLELQLNYVPSDWAASTVLGAMVGDGIGYVFRFTLMNANPAGYASDAVGGAAALGMVENSMYFWYGKVEALLVTPQLTDANTATLTLSLQSDFYGAFTVNP
jgi:hypothetical protein